MLAVFPEMRTAMRTYHPVPSMQMHEYTRKNLQDAPRLKSQLKAALLPQELKDAPETLSGIAYAAVSPVFLCTSACLESMGFTGYWQTP